MECVLTRPHQIWYPVMTRQVFAAVFIALLGVSVFAQTIERAEVRPNILLVVVDDAGFMDFGAYGSDTSTPTIDALGASGSKFTHYYTTPLCGPSRAALLTGMSAHQVGAATLAEVLTDEMRRIKINLVMSYELVIY